MDVVTANVKRALVSDKFSALLWDASFSLILLANESTGDWELIEPQPIQTDAARTYHGRGLCFGGVLGIVGGKAKSALAVDLDNETVDRVSAEFIARWKRSITHPRFAAPIARGLN